MADVRPFRAVTYAHAPGEDISARTAPPYDVIPPEQRTRLLARDPHNVVALELPEGPLDPDDPDGRYAVGARRWREWLDTGVLGRDAEPGIYVLEQRYEREGRAIRRRAFVAAVRLEPFSAGVVLPHERTLPKALDDRLSLLRSTHANLSQVLGLFPDPAGVTDGVFEAVCATAPSLVATGDDGAESRVWAVTDDVLIGSVREALAPERIFIADGHHRYTTALAYRDERRANDPAPDQAAVPDDPAYDFVMMALVNMDDPELVVLPTHRVADAEGEFDEGTFWDALSKHFSIEELPQGHPGPVLDDVSDRPTYVVKTRARTALVRLRDDVDPTVAIPGEASAAWKSLDVTVLQELILDPLLGIHPDRPATLERLSFAKEAHDALRGVGEHDVAFILAPTRMEQLRSVALSGETMPQKSTYFFPKLLSGLLFRVAG